MAAQQGTIRVALNGYGVIGKRVADAVARQEDMELVGVADIETDWRLRLAQQKGFQPFASLDDRADAMRKAGLKLAGTIDIPLTVPDEVVDSKPKPIGGKHATSQPFQGVKLLLQ